MKLTQKDQSFLFSNTAVPDVFFAEYLSSANGDFIKVYLYIFYLSKYNKDIKLNDLSKKLNLSLKTIQEAMQYWETQNVVTKTPSGYILNDLQELELHSLYSPKLSSSPEETKKTEKNKSRAKAIENINNLCFQGMMRPTWYNDIDLWFKKYGFDEEVMIALFNYCFQRNGTSKNYIQTVAEGWAKNNIKNFTDLDNYFLKQENFNVIKKSISKKLGFHRELTQYETAYVEKWVVDYGFSLDIIEIALKKTTSKTNPNFDYLNKILSDWHDRNLKTTDEIENYLKNSKIKNKNIKELEKNSSKLSYKNYEQRNYDNLNSLYTNDF